METETIRKQSIPRGYLYRCKNCGFEKRKGSKWRGFECPDCYGGCMNLVREPVRINVKVTNVGSNKLIPINVKVTPYVEGESNSSKLKNQEENK